MSSSAQSIFIYGFNKNPSYISSYILFNAKSTNKDLRSYVPKRTQALLQAYYASDNVIKSRESQSMNQLIFIS